MISSLNNQLSAGKRVILPEECYTSKYSCTLKKLKGQAFLCVRTSKQRLQSARKKIKIIQGINCLKRLPVEYAEYVESLTKPVEKR
jgi:hypothetical protein